MSILVTLLKGMEFSGTSRLIALLISVIRDRETQRERVPPSHHLHPSSPNKISNMSPAHKKGTIMCECVCIFPLSARHSLIQHATSCGPAIKTNNTFNYHGKAFRMQHRRDTGELQLKLKQNNKTKIVACKLQKEESTHCIHSSTNIDDLKNKDFKAPLVNELGFL